ncbi:hypothetical protein MKW98_011252, partial [Papaver atlanticum]
MSKIGKFIEGLPTDCKFCYCEEESVDHIFLRCPVAQAVLFASPLNLGLTDSTSVHGKQFLSDCVTKKSDDYFYMVACLFWAIWKARNAVTFESQKHNIGSILREGLFWYKEFDDDCLQIANTATAPESSYQT